MKSRIPYIKKIIHVKKFAAADLTLDKLEPGTLAFTDEDLNKTVKPTTLGALPTRAQLVFNLNGKLVQASDLFLRTNVTDVTAKKYTTERVAIYKTIVDCCDCIDTVILNVKVQGSAIAQNIGRDFIDFAYTVTAPPELNCFCDCSGKGTYANHIMTYNLLKQIAAKPNPYFTAYARIVDGEELATPEAVLAHIEKNKKVNTDDDAKNDTAKLSLHIKAKPAKAEPFMDDRDVVSNRAFKLIPSVSINGTYNVPFEQTQEPRYEIGAGADLRREEWDNCNNYTTLNYMHRDGDGRINPIQFQFENGKNYDTITFNASSYKSDKSGEGDRKGTTYVLGMIADSDISKEMFKFFNR